MVFSPGDRVKTHGLSSENLNNKLGTVTKFIAKRDKYAVEFDEPINGVLKQAVAECNLRSLGGGSSSKSKTIPTPSGGKITSAKKGFLNSEEKKQKLSGKCTRCLRDASVGMCKIEHPKQYLKKGQCTMEFRGPRAGCMAQQVHCDGCNQDFEMTSAMGGGEERITSGPKYCYEGPHTTEELTADDKRRLAKAAVTIVIGDESGQSAQKKIDAFAKSGRSKQVKALIIRARDYCEEKFKFEISLPKLEELTIDDALVEKLVLNDTLTPSLARLSVSNAAQDVVWNVTCSKLTYINLRHVTPFQKERPDRFVDLGKDCCIQEMINKSDALQHFDSYKLYNVGGLAFVGDHLKNVTLHRAESCTRVSICSQRIETVNCQSCWSLKQLRLKEVPSTDSNRFRGRSLSPKMPLLSAGVDINLYNCVALPQKQITALQNDPRVLDVKVGEAPAHDGMTAMENNHAQREKYMAQSGIDTSTIQGMMAAMGGFMKQQHTQNADFFGEMRAGNDDDMDDDDDDEFDDEFDSEFDDDDDDDDEDELKKNLENISGI